MPVQGKRHKKAPVKRKGHSREQKQNLEADLLETDDEANEETHNKLIQAIKSLDGKKAPIPQRNEPTYKVSEFHSKGGKKINVKQLLKPLKPNTFNKLKKIMDTKGKSKKVAKPQDKHVVNKAERQVTYEENRKELDKWQTVVEEQRTAPHIEFPLYKSKIAITDIKTEAFQHQPSNSLEQEIQALIKGPNYKATEDPAKPLLTSAEQRVQRAMDIEKAKEELALRRKHRLMVADLASKNKRQNKIKSRNYRRHLKASRRKEAFKALEKLKAENPQLWLEKAEEMERARVEERGTLKHRGNSKFAKISRRYGKFNDKIKESLDEMRAKGVQLLAKPQEEEEDEEEGEEEVGSDVDITDSDDDSITEVKDKNNPWMLSKPKANNIRVTFKKPEPISAQDNKSSEDTDDEGNNETIEVKDAEETIVYNVDTGDDKAEEDCGSETLIDDLTQLENDADEMVEGQTNVRFRTLAEVERFDEKFVKIRSTQEKKTSSQKIMTAEPKRKPDNNIDPNKVIEIPSTDLSGAAVMNHADSSDDEVDQHRLHIAEAFADDDVVEEFMTRRKRKFEEDDAEADKAITSIELPGWGYWAGAGLKKLPPHKLPFHKRKQLEKEQALKAKRQAERDSQRSKYPKHVIVNEKAINQLPIAKYQVPNLPEVHNSGTFKSVMSYPVGRDFVPSLAYKELVRPRVQTALGNIIDPMDKHEVLQEANKSQSKNTFTKSNMDPTRKIAEPYKLNLNKNQLEKLKKIHKQLK